MIGIFDCLKIKNMFIQKTPFKRTKGHRVKYIYVCMYVYICKIYCNLYTLQSTGIQNIQSTSFHQKKKSIQGFPGGAVVKNLPANAGDTGLSPSLGRSHMPWSS